MNLLSQLQPTIVFKNHLSSQLVEEFAERMQPLMKQMGLNYLALWQFTSTGYTALYSNLAIAEAFQDYNNYHLGVMRVQANHVSNLKAGLTQEALDTLKQQHNIAEGCTLTLQQGEGHFGIHATADNHETLMLISQQEIMTQVMKETFAECPDLLEKVQAQVIPWPSKGAAAKAIKAHYTQVLKSRFARKKSHIKNDFTAEYNGHVTKLSAREFECLQLIIHRNTNDEVAEALNLSLTRTEKMIRQIKTKLRCYNRDQLAAAAMQSGLLASKASKTRRQENAEKTSLRKILASLKQPATEQ